jgi:hypothetical protein
VEFPMHDAFPWAKCCFGYRLIDATHVKIYGGEIQIADATPVAAFEATLEITVDYSLVGYEYNHGTGAFAIKNFGASITYDASYYRKWLYEFRLVSGAISLNRLNFMGASLPSNFGDTPT